MKKKKRFSFYVTTTRVDRKAAGIQFRIDPGAGAGLYELGYAVPFQVWKDNPEIGDAVENGHLLKVKIIDPKGSLTNGGKRVLNYLNKNNIKTGSINNLPVVWAVAAFAAGLAELKPVDKAKKKEDKEDPKAKKRETKAKK